MTRFKYGLYFRNSRRLVVFFLFFWVVYRLMPATPVSRCSVHSRWITVRATFFFLAKTHLSDAVRPPAANDGKAGHVARRRGEGNGSPSTTVTQNTDRRLNRPTIGSGSAHGSVTTREIDPVNVS